MLVLNPEQIQLAMLFSLLVSFASLPTPTEIQAYGPYCVYTHTGIC